MIVTYGGEALYRVVEYSHPPAAQAIQDFTVHVQEVSSRPIDATVSNDRDLRLARLLFELHDYRDMPYKRVIGRVLDELQNHRGTNTCSAGDVYLVLLEESQHNLPTAHRQHRPFNKTLDPGRKAIGNRLNKLKGRAPRGGAQQLLALVTTTTITQGGAEQGYRLTEDGRRLFDGWPELPELILGRSRATVTATR